VRREQILKLTPWQIRKRLLEVCHLAARKGYVVAYEGNFSARLPDGNLLVTPSRKNKGDLVTEDLVTTDLNGKPRPGQGLPSSEIRIHTLLYSELPECMAIAHAHPPYATAFAVAGLEMCVDCMPETFVELGSVPLVPYGTPGTHELPDRLRERLDGARGFLLEHHGVVTIGKSVDEAFYRLETVEQAAHILYLARGLGGERRLNPEQKQKLLGQTGGA
jgi:L-fuculose-phosphate aldolase